MNRRRNAHAVPWWLGRQAHAALPRHPRALFKSEPGQWDAYWASAA